MWEGFKDEEDFKDAMVFCGIVPSRSELREQVEHFVQTFIRTNRNPQASVESCVDPNYFLLKSIDELNDDDIVAIESNPGWSVEFKDNQYAIVTHKDDFTKVFLE